MEDTVVERYDNIRVKIALVVALWVRLLTDGLGIIVLVARVVRDNLRPSLFLVLNIIASLEELEPILARKESIVLGIAEYPAEQARALNHEQVLLVLV
jgi:hypothetical protein